MRQTANETYSSRTTYYCRVTSPNPRPTTLKAFGAATIKPPHTSYLEVVNASLAGPKENVVPRPVGNNRKWFTTNSGKGALNTNPETDQSLPAAHVGTFGRRNVQHRGKARGNAGGRPVGETPVLVREGRGEGEEAKKEVGSACNGGGLGQREPESYCVRSRANLRTMLGGGEKLWH